MQITEFGVEMWMNEYETQCQFNLAETCVESLTVGELLRLTGATDTVMRDLLPMKLTYGDITGSARLRHAIAALYAGQTAANVLVTHGAIGANALVHQALVEPGDRVVAIVPTYQQHYAIPESLGADVRLLRLREDQQFLPDFEELARLAGGRAKLIALSNPNNPTGALVDQAGLERIAAIARACGAYVLCDEVYRGLEQARDDATASMADLYERGISTGSMSKAFSLAGLRLGWITSPADVLQRCMVHRDYTTISVGMVDDYLAALALEHRDAILRRSRAIVRENLGVLEAWIAAEPQVTYVKPHAGTTALLKYDSALPSRDVCRRLLDATGVLLTPGSAMDAEGWLRIGYANSRAVLEAGLERVSDFLAQTLPR